MGMDLVPRHKEVEVFGFNWTGWNSLSEELSKLGCDLSEMDVMNDGKYISSQTLKAWADALELQFGKHPENCPMDTCGGTESGSMGWKGGWEAKLRCFANWARRCGGCWQR